MVGGDDSESEMQRRRGMAVLFEGSLDQHGSVAGLEKHTSVGLRRKITVPRSIEKARRWNGGRIKLREEIVATLLDKYKRPYPTGALHPSVYKSHRVWGL